MASRTIPPPVAARRWTPSTVWQRALEVLRTEGIRSLWFRVLGETGYRRMIVMQRPYDLSLRDVEAGIPVTYGILEPHEIDEYLQLRPDADSDDIRLRLERRQVCLVARHEGHLIQACWVAFERVWIDYLRCWLYLEPGAVYPYDLYAVPEIRGKNVHRAHFPHMFRYFQNAGIRVIVGAFHPENRMHRIFARVGFEPVATIGVVRLGPWRRPFCRYAEGKPGRLAFSVRDPLRKTPTLDS
jgi:GNAT superfamily N-acetyltransferase